jgi:hypothetical protein
MPIKAMKVRKMPFFSPRAHSISLDVAPPHAFQPIHTRAEYSDLEEEEEAGGEEQEEQDDAEGEALQDEAESSQVLQQQRRELAMDALGAWVSTFQPRTLSQKKRNARRSAKSAGHPGAPPLTACFITQAAARSSTHGAVPFTCTGPYLEVERKILSSLWNIESGASSESTFGLIYSWVSHRPGL